MKPWEYGVFVHLVAVINMEFYSGRSHFETDLREHACLY